MGEKLDADDLQEVVAVCDNDGIILSWNKAGKDITGFARADVIGYHVDSVVAPASRPDLQRILGVQRSGSILPGQSLLLQTNFGMEVPAELTVFPRRNLRGRTEGMVLVFRDTTLKVQLQEQLDRLDQLYRKLVEQSPDLVYVLDDKARVLFINDTAERLLGYTKKDLVGKELIEIVHPEDRAHAYWPLRERRKDDRATRNLQLRLVTRAGMPRRYDLDFVYVSLSAMGLSGSRSGDATEVLGTQGVARDVTELLLLREFSRQVGLILPVCSVCRKIRVEEGAESRWIALGDYLTRKTGILFSHTYCPDHVPPME
jgi:PAS domain S-box-containing protein